MQWLFDWWDQFVQGVVIDSLFSSFVWFDWLILLGVALGVIYGIRKGLMRILAEIVETVIVIHLVMMTYPKVALFLTTLMAGLPQAIASVIAFGLSMSLIWLAMAILDSYLRKILSTQLYKPIKVMGGAAMGGLQALLICSLFAYFFYLMPLRQVKRIFESGTSLTGHQIVNIAPMIHKTLKDPMAFLSSSAPMRSPIHEI